MRFLSICLVLFITAFLASAAQVAGEKKYDTVKKSVSPKSVIVKFNDDTILRGKLISFSEGVFVFVIGQKKIEYKSDKIKSITARALNGKKKTNEKKRRGKNFEKRGELRKLLRDIDTTSPKAIRKWISKDFNLSRAIALGNFVKLENVSDDVYKLVRECAESDEENAYLAAVSYSLWKRRSGEKREARKWFKNALEKSPNDDMRKRLEESIKKRNEKGQRKNRNRRD